MMLLAVYPLLYRLPIVSPHNSMSNYGSDVIIVGSSELFYGCYTK